MGNEAARLQSAIRALEEIVERDGPSRFAMVSLARLHALRAVALAGSGACSEALAEMMEAIRQEAATISHVDPE